MKTEKFIEAVRDMRRKQSIYFKTKSPYMLREAKQAEHIVDNMIKRWDANQIQTELVF